MNNNTFCLFIFYLALCFVSSFVSESYGIIGAILAGAYMVAQAIYDVNDDDDDD